MARIFRNGDRVRCTDLRGMDYERKLRGKDALPIYDGTIEDTIYPANGGPASVVRFTDDTTEAVNNDHLELINDLQDGLAVRTVQELRTAIRRAGRYLTVTAGNLSELADMLDDDHDWLEISIDGPWGTYYDIEDDGHDVVVRTTEDAAMLSPYAEVDLRLR